MTFNAIARARDHLISLLIIGYTYHDLIDVLSYCVETVACFLVSFPSLESQTMSLK